MRELIEKGERVIVVPHDYKYANKGIVSEVQPNHFVIDLVHESDGMLKNNYCEFYVQTPNGTLYFDSYPTEVGKKTLSVASPAKHKFLQRRQYTRIKYILDLDLESKNKPLKITTLDISAGGMKFKTKENINIQEDYTITLPLSEEQSVKCVFSPIRIEKSGEDNFTISGKFDYSSGHDKMILTQYCAKRSIEIKNK